ncbi:MAG: sulfatase family protein [Nocardioidaceae bacterium]
MATRRVPNIVIISSDQQRFDAMGCYGNDAIRTPALDALADEGALFENCYSQSPMCSPSRASLMTGLFPRNHGLWANGVALPSNRRLLSRILADTGYDCGLIGKFHLAPCAGGRTEPRGDDGFRMFEWAHDPTHTSPQNRYQQWLAEHHPDIYSEYRTTVDRQAWDSEAGNQARGALYLDTVRPEAHYSSWVANQAIEFIRADERSSDQPFFLVANFFDPHHPFGAPPQYRGLYDATQLPRPIGGVTELAGKPEAQLSYSRSSYAGTSPGFQDYSSTELQELIANYYGMVSLVDAQVARILEALVDAGASEDTLVIYTSDHGEMLGDHGMVLKGPMMYECAVKVPLLMRWPAIVPPGTRIDALTQTIDLTSTVLHAAGLTQAMPWVQGEDLVPLTRDPQAPARNWALVEYRDAGFPEQPPIHTTMLRRGDHKLVLWHGTPATDRKREGELYDLAADPNELHNLWDEPDAASVRNELIADLVDVLAATEDRSQERTAAW